MITEDVWKNGEKVGNSYLPDWVLLLLWERLQSFDRDFCTKMVVIILTVGRGISQNTEAADNLLK